MSTQTIVRPNGKVYRPRKGLRVAEFDNNANGYGYAHGLIVLGTHDVAVAVDAATRSPGDYICGGCQA